MLREDDRAGADMKRFGGAEGSDETARVSAPNDGARPDDERLKHDGEMRRPKPREDNRDATGHDEAEDGADGEGEAPRQSIFHRHPYIIAALVAVVILLAIGGFLYWYLDLRHYETSDDAFIDARQFAIAPKISGYIVGVPVTDNQFVGAGSPIVEIDDRDYRVALEQADAQVAGSQATLEGLKAQVAAQQAQVDEAKAAVVQAQAQLGFAQADAARYRELAAKGAGTVQQAQQSTANLQVAEASLAKSQATVTAAQKQITAILAQQTNGGANLLLAKAQLDQARLNLTYTTVKAAQSGTVVRLSAAQGAYVQAGQGLAMFVPSTIWVTANYKETQITDMQPGQPVDIEVDAYPGRQFKGHLDSVQPGSGTAFSLLPAQNATGNYVKVVQRIPVKIVFDDLPKDIVLGPGMSVVPSVRVR